MKQYTTKEIIEDSNKAAIEIQRDLGIDGGIVSECLLGKWVSVKDIKEFILQKGDSYSILEKLKTELEVQSR